MSIDSLYLDFSKSQYTVITGGNASGKSSLLEAISMALNERRKGNSYRDYVQIGKKKATIDMQVNLEGRDMRIVIEINNNKYGVPVQRTIYMDKEIYINSDCTKLLKTFNVKYLQHITFSHQKDSGILDLKPTEVSAILKELFDIDYSAQIHTISQDIVTMEETDLSLKSKLEASERFLSSLRLRDLAQISMDELSNYRNELVVKERLLANLDDTKDQLKKIEELTSSLKVAKVEMEKHKQRRIQHGLETQAYDGRLKVVEESIIKTLQEAEEDTENLSKDVEDLRHLDFKLSEEIRRDRDKLPTEKSSLERLERELKAYQAKVCPVCEHDLSSESSKIPIIEKSIEKHRLLLKGLELKISEDSNKHDTQSKLLSRKIKDLSSAEIKISQAKERLPKLLQEKEHLLKDTAIKTSYMQDADSEILRLGLLLAEEQEELESLVVPEDLSAIKRISDEIYVIKTSIARIERNIVINEERERGNSKILKDQVDLKKEIDFTKKEINALDKKILNSKEALNLLSTDFPNYVILQRTSQLENSINDIIQKIFPGMVVKLTLKRSGISFYYSPKGDDQYLPAKMASGAQSAVLMLAWRVALAEMYGIDTLILDEIDADANDDNSAIIYEFIGSLTMFNQIIVISHRKMSIKTIKDINENVQSYWVENGKYLSDSPELNV